MQINTNYANLQDSYLFLTIAKKVAAYTQAHPENRIIRMGIGDVTQPLVPAVIEAMHKATDEMAHKETFHGYSPDQGYDFLREAIQGYYAKRGVSLKLSEIFVGDGAKSDIGNIVAIFGEDNRVLIPDPVYPVYVDTNVMSGRLSRRQRAKRLPRHAGRKHRGGHHLSLLAEQPDRRRVQPRAARGVGGLRAAARGGHPL